MKDSAVLPLKPISFWHEVGANFQLNPIAVAGSLIFCTIAFLAISVPLFSSYSYDQISLVSKNLPPSLEHFFGTDDLGRDVFIRIWYGARISLFVGFAAGILDFFIGIMWGGLAASVGGKLDELLMRIADVIYSLPSLLLVISVMVILGPGLHTILAALALVGWIPMARLVRSQLLILKQQNYVIAAKALGAGFWHIFFKHLIPNAIGPIIVTLAFSVPSSIFTEAFLSYLGLGIQAPIASLGTMANEGLPALEYYPWRILFPAFLICIMTLSLHLIADGLQESFKKASHR